jgi:hypothetical protein
MITQHLSKSVEHYTPAHVVEAARRTMGGIDLDPASCEVANKTVQAAEYFQEFDDGMSAHWHGRVFLNPPGGRTPDGWRRHYRTASNACAWWRKLMEEVAFGRVKEAVFIGFTLELLRSAQGSKWGHPFDFTICVPSERLKFSGASPTHANVIVYLGPNVDRFEREFSPIGRVKR